MVMMIVVIVDSKQPSNCSLVQHFTVDTDIDVDVNVVVVVVVVVIAAYSNHKHSTVMINEDSLTR